MNDLKYDAPKHSEMQKFLDYLYAIASQNKDIVLDENIVYNELCKVGVKSKDLGSKREFLDNEKLFFEWQNRNIVERGDVKNLIVYRSPNWKYFLQFFSVNNNEEFNKNGEYIKLYIPIDHEHLYISVNDIFDYITDENIKHKSKVSREIRCDNVIIRLKNDDIESAKKIINYISNNRYIKEGLNKTNPFVPTINGIGFMYETGISYNFEMARILSSYINICLNLNKKPTISNFYRYLKNNNSIEEVNRIFEIAVGFKDDLNYSNTNEINNIDKNQVILNALNSTYQKYGIDHLSRAIFELIKNDEFGYFTNDYNFRNQMIKIVSKEDMLEFVSKNLGKSNIDYIDICEYCYNMFRNDIMNNFRKVCEITLYNHNEYQLKEAIKNFIMNNNAEYFSRFSSSHNDKINYRDLIKKIGQYGSFNSILESLKTYKIDYSNMSLEELINAYISNIIMEDNYDIFAQKSIKKR